MRFGGRHLNWLSHYFNLARICSVTALTMSSAWESAAGFCGSGCRNGAIDTRIPFAVIAELAFFEAETAVRNAEALFDIEQIFQLVRGESLLARFPTENRPPPCGSRLPMISIFQ